LIPCENDKNHGYITEVHNFKSLLNYTQLSSLLLRVFFTYGMFIARSIAGATDFPDT